VAFSKSGIPRARRLCWQKHELLMPSDQRRGQRAIPRYASALRSAPVMPLPYTSWWGSVKDCLVQHVPIWVLRGIGSTLCACEQEQASVWASGQQMLHMLLAGPCLSLFRWTQCATPASSPSYEAVPHSTLLPRTVSSTLDSMSCWLAASALTNMFIASSKRRRPAASFSNAAVSAAASLAR
jgi:hypothetical protein